MWYFIWTLLWSEQRAVDLMHMWGGNAVWGHLRCWFIKIMNVTFPGTASTTANIRYLQLSLNICLLLNKNSPRNAFRVSLLWVKIPLGVFFFIHPRCWKSILVECCIHVTVAWFSISAPETPKPIYHPPVQWWVTLWFPVGSSGRNIQLHQFSSRRNHRVGRFHPQISQLNTVLLLVWGSSSISLIGPRLKWYFHVWTTLINIRGNSG